MFSRLLGLISTLVALFGVFISDWSAIRDNGFFHGYSYLVWVVILLQVGVLMYICACVYVCYVHVCMCVMCMYVCVFMYICACMYVC